MSSAVYQFPMNRSPERWKIVFGECSEYHRSEEAATSRMLSVLDDSTAKFGFVMRQTQTKEQDIWETRYAFVLDRRQGDVERIEGPDLVA